MSNSSNIINFQDQKEIEAEAALWFVKLDGDRLSSEDYVAFKEWRARSKQHQSALESMSKMWGGLEALKELEDIAHAVVDEVTPDERRFSMRKIVFAAAASIVAVLVGGFLLQDMGAFRPQHSNSYSTAVGAQETVELPDGSKIKLNTNSQIQVEISRSEREVRLVKGEAHFEVASEPQWPFSVYVGEGVVRAVGTAFTVQLHAKSFEVTVLEGRVAVLPSVDQMRPLSQVKQETEVDETVMELTIGQNAVVGAAIKSVELMPEGELERKLSWRTGILAFAGEPLSKVVEDISRYTDVRIKIDDPTLQSLPIGGYFKVGEIEAMFDALEITFGLDVEWVDEKSVRIFPAS